MMAETPDYRRGNNHPNSTTVESVVELGWSGRGVVREDDGARWGEVALSVTMAVRCSPHHVSPIDSSSRPSY